MTTFLDIFDILPPLESADDGIVRMHFGIGWIITISIVFLLNLFIAWHYAAAKFQKHRGIKLILCASLHLALAIPSLIYWIKFFGGFSYEPYMKYLAYYAGFYLCIFFYAAGAFFFWDVFRLVRRIYRKIKKKDPLLRYTGKKLLGRFGALYSVRITVVLMLLCTVCAVAAFYVPRHIVTTYYQVNIDKREGDLDRLRAVMISDTHIGPAIREKEIDEIADKIMAESPEIIFLAGDIFDEGTPDFLKEYTSKSWSRLKAPYGIYFILGNHDDYRGDTEAVLDYFRRAGIKCLRDQVVLKGRSFYLIGREDHPARRDELTQLEQIVTEDLPVILLDHRPIVRELKNSDKVRLQLSGHTHDGQIYPAHLLDPFNWTYSYGSFKIGQSQLLVSSGAGEFGVPVRLGSPAEILVIDIAFQ